MFDRAMHRSDAAAIGIHVVEPVHLAIRTLFRIHLTLLRVLTADKTIILRAVDRDASGMLRTEGLRHLLPNIDTDRRVRAFARVIEIAADPAVSLKLFRVAGRLPNFSR